MSLILRAVTVTDPGLVRENNEDSAYAGRRLIAVADGIGGSPSGEVASHIVINELAPLDGEPAEGDPAEALLARLAQANSRIREVTDADPASEGMGTTLTVVLFDDGRATLLQVGDSRAYLLHEDELSQLTVDDTLVQAMIERGLLTPAEARVHPHRSIITQAVQGREFTPTILTLQLRPGDRLMLCSDGLSDVVDDEAIAEVMSRVIDVRPCADRLVSLALAGGAPDNVTVVVADVVTG
ncbi:hypothetical protein Cs7R123_79830 [Catellatospora sp. TT07R-123]|uniref:PP2C family protein-serine/threonine phosphatase n=1 Tax=Catellatospora sp. TT07R-123 TaxID=2733863 RepID=UPI001B170270|nr:protein phosphatase 2C domain-containing protein [Catellatospora sp. TT07R-123]GHJ50641.1 hypothetical protein Cs7R123_79830 [Catellatospora sp. TT07R-123]